MPRHIARPAQLAAVVTALAMAVVSAQQAPQFRAGVTLVPVEVSVIDKNGRPVEGLTADDFSVREDSVPQQIAHFQVLSRTTSGPASPRTFMIVLGRGYLDKPTNAVRALIDFVHRAAPDDRIGIAAYLRVLPPSADHDAVERFLALFQQRHEAIENLIERDAWRDWLSGPPRLQADTRSAIDGLFRSTVLRPSILRDPRDQRNPATTTSPICGTPSFI